MENIQLRIEGEDAEALAASLATFAKDEWGIDATSTPIKPKAAKVGDKDWGTSIGIALGVAGVITNLPGFLNSKMLSSLAWRIGAKDDLEKLIAWLEKQPPEQKASISLVIEDNIDNIEATNNAKQIKLGKAQLTEMLDALQENGFGVDE